MNRRLFLKALGGMLAAAATPRAEIPVGSVTYGSEIYPVEVEWIKLPDYPKIDWSQWNTVELRVFGKRGLQLLINEVDHTFDDTALAVVSRWSDMNGNCLRIGAEGDGYRMDLPEDISTVAFQVKMSASAEGLEPEQHVVEGIKSRS